jgi:hypothetical protein
MSTAACACCLNQGERTQMAGKKDSRGTIAFRLYSRVKVDPEGGCFNWTGAVSNKYGSLYYDGRMQKTHRIAWLLKNWEIPKGKDLDHLCRNTLCCNTDHLEVVSRSENLRRSPIIGDSQRNKTHCPRGHKYSGDNLAIRKGNGWRTCRTCMRQHIRNWRAKCEAVL